MADAKSQKLQIAFQNGIFFLAGSLNEFSDFTPMLKADEPLKINLRHINRCNSIGIKLFLDFLTKWGERPFEYHEAPSIFVDQINYIPALLGPTAANGSIASLFVPYLCDSCGLEDEVLVGIAGNTAVGPDYTPPPRTCPKCGKTMQLANPAFFSFLSS